MIMEKVTEHSVQWKTMKLGDICEPSSEKYNPLTESLFQDCIEMENINQESGTINGKSDITKLLSLKTKFHKGEVLYGKLRPYLRKYWLADFDGACSTEIWVLKSAENIDNRFLFYLFQSEFINKIANLSSGTKMPRADWKLMATQEVNIPYKNNNPDLYAQRRIAAILSAADKVIEQTRQLISKYKSIKQGMMEDLLKPKEGWKKVKLGEVCERITDGSHDSPKAIEEGYFMPSVKDMSYNCFDFSSCKQISENDYLRLKSSGCKPDIGDVLIAKDGSILKYCFVVEEDLPIVILSSIAILKPKQTTIDSHFLSYYFQKRDVVNDVVENYKSGTGVPRIVLRNFEKIEITYPNALQEQRRIAKILSGIDRKIEAEEKVLEKYEKMKKGLMERMLMFQTITNNKNI